MSIIQKANTAYRHMTRADSFSIMLTLNVHHKSHLIMSSPFNTSCESNVPPSREPGTSESYCTLYERLKSQIYRYKGQVRALQNLRVMSYDKRYNAFKILQKSMSFVDMHKLHWLEQGVFSKAMNPDDHFEHLERLEKELLNTPCKRRREDDAFMQRKRHNMFNEEDIQSDIPVQLVVKSDRRDKDHAKEVDMLNQAAEKRRREYLDLQTILLFKETLPFMARHKMVKRIEYVLRKENIQSEYEKAIQIESLAFRESADSESYYKLCDDAMIDITSK